MRASLLLFSLLCLMSTGYAQEITSYTMSTGNNETFAGMGSTTTLIGSGESNTSSAVTDIGFDVVYMGEVYNTFSVNTNGVLRLGDEQVLAGANTYGIPGNARIVPLANVSMQRYVSTSCFFGWCWDNYETVTDGLGTHTNGKVHYAVQGSAPNRVLIVEWQRMQFPAGSGESNGTFRVRLYESAPGATDAGRIDFVYGNFSLPSGYQDAYYRVGFGVGPESGNYYAIDPTSDVLTSTLNYTVGPADDLSPFASTPTTRKYYSFVSDKQPAGNVSNINPSCPATNAFNLTFEENGSNEAGIVVMRKQQGQSDEQFKVVRRLPPDARAFSDGTFTPGQSYVYRFYLVGEGKFSDSYVDYSYTPGMDGGGLQPVNSGNWSENSVWGAASALPTVSDDVTIGCVSPVFVDIDTDASTHDLTIESGSFLTVKDGTTLEIAGDFINNGVFTVEGTGKVLFSGSENQLIVNNGFGITNDNTFSTAPADSWDASELGIVSESTITVPADGYSGLKSVTVDLDYPKMRNINVFLITPDGSSITLLESRGQNGQDLDNVTFMDTGQQLPPSIQNVDLSGTYRPEETLSSYAGTFAGDWTLRVVTTFDEYAGTLNTFDLTLSKGGSNDIVFNDMEVDKTAGTYLSLESGLRITGEMVLRRGVFLSSDAHPVTFTEGATTNSGNENSYIDGPAVKEGNDYSFVFPLGKEGKWAPLRIWNPQGADSNLEMKAEYFYNAPADADNIEASLDRVSKVEYWDLHHETGSLSGLDVTFYWRDAEESDIIDLSSGDLVIAHYTGGQWVNEGGSFLSGSDTGTDANGGLVVTGLSTFSPFTFGSTTGLNPLPVELLHFRGEGTLDGNLLDWATATERDNDYFELYRSRNAQDWTFMSRVNGVGDSDSRSDYTYTDRDVQEGGTYYYMLKQVDRDGTTTQLDVVRVSSAFTQAAMMAYPNPVPSANRMLHLKHTGIDYQATIQLVTAEGRTILEAKQVFDNGATTIDCSGLPAGMYILKLIGDSEVKTLPIILK